VSALRDRGALAGRVDPGGEVGHVEHEAREVDREHLHHGHGDPTLDLFQLGLADRIHRFPEATVVERAGSKPQPPIVCGLVPPVGEGELRARIDHPIERRQGDAGSHRRPGIATTSTRHLIHDLCGAQPAQHLPHRGDVPEGEVARAIRLARSGPREPGGDLLGRA